MLCCVLSHVQRFASLWTSPPGSSIHEDSPDKNTGVGCCALLQGSSKPRDRNCVSYVSCFGRQVLYYLCHLGNPIIYLTYYYFPPSLYSLYGIYDLHELQFAEIYKISWLTKNLAWTRYYRYIIDINLLVNKQNTSKFLVHMIKTCYL